VTTPQQPFDTGNPLLAAGPAQMTTALMDTPGGQRLAVTIRTASTTLTVLLSQEDARTWGSNITATSKQMSAAGLIVAGAGAVPANGNGKAAAGA
jgi:hypothetical protein